MLKNLLSKLSARKTHVGIECQPNGLAVAVCADKWVQTESVASLRPQILHSDILLDESSISDQATMLTDWVETHGLTGCPCNLVLPSSDYQLLLVEAPDVPEVEMREAVRWRIKDLISIPVAKAAIDVFLLPHDGSRGKKMAYVVVAELSRLSSLVSLVNQSGLSLESIDIGELALRNLAYLQDLDHPESRGVAIVRLLEGQGSVSLYRKGNMYLSRQFQIKYGAGLLDDIPIDSFILEVQRSLDYYERQMGQPPPTNLYICGDNISEDKITTDILRGLSVPVKYLNFTASVSVDDENKEPLLHACAAALGAALRNSVAGNIDSVGAP